MQEMHIGKQSVPQMAWDSIVMALWEIGLQIAKRLWEKMHNKEYQLCFANGDSRQKKEMLRQEFAFGVRYQYFTEIWKNRLNKQKMAFS